MQIGRSVSRIIRGPLTYKDASLAFAESTEAAAAEEEGEEVETINMTMEQGKLTFPILVLTPNVISILRPFPQTRPLYLRPVSVLLISTRRRKFDEFSSVLHAEASGIPLIGDNKIIDPTSDRNEP